MAVDDVHKNHVYFSSIAGSPPVVQKIYPNNTQDIAENQTASVSCNFKVGTEQILDFAICYAPPGESYDELTLASNCILCNGYSNGSCPTNFHKIASRPMWMVREQTIQRPLDCDKEVTTTLEIPEVTGADNNGIVYCMLMQDRTLDAAKVYHQYNLKVQSTVHVPRIPVHKTTKPLYSLIVVPLFILSVIVAVTVVVIRRRRTRLRHPGTLIESTGNSHRHTGKLEYLLSLYIHRTSNCTIIL